MADVGAQVRRLHVHGRVLHAHPAVGVARLHAVHELRVHGGRGRQAAGGADDFERGHGGGDDVVARGVRAQYEVRDQRRDPQHYGEEHEQHAEDHADRAAQPPHAVLSEVDAVVVAFALEWYPPHADTRKSQIALQRRRLCGHDFLLTIFAPAPHMLRELNLLATQPGDGGGCVSQIRHSNWLGYGRTDWRYFASSATVARFVLLPEVRFVNSGEEAELYDFNSTHG